jgi:hypothetical protein
MDSSDALHCPEMGAHRLVGLEEGSLGEKVQLKVGKEEWKCIGIMPFRYLSCIVGYAETIGAGSQWPRYGGFEQTILMEARHGNGLPSSLIEEDRNVVCIGEETPNRNGRGTALGHRMSAEYRKGIPVVTLDKLLELIERQF